MTFIATILTSLLSILVVLVGPKFSDEKHRNTVRAVALLIGILAATASLLKTFTIIPSGKVGVIEVFGKVDPQPLNPGVHWVNPFGNVLKFSTRLRDMPEKMAATSQEGLNLVVEGTIQYRLDPNSAADLYQNVGVNDGEIVRSRFQAIMREITSSYPARDIYTAKREEITRRLRLSMRESLTPLGFIVEEAFLKDVALPEKLQAAIEQKMEVEQDNQRMELVLEKERQEAERKRIEALGIAEYQQIISPGLTSQFLQWRNIEATDRLANSNNSKVVIMGGSGNNATTPVILQP
ncbi:prohibitin family protein [Laspinema sp. D1]|uniref:prohibitin family protein n=1 Tax=Laspinema palackyanum TaxID=3231601 RepID=UPI003499087F|nr:prohibitin family protein [Laspinema sp. D2b]